MKRSQFSLLTLIAAALLLNFSSCLSDKCVEDYTYKVYTPVYMSLADLRSAVQITGPAALENSGKIYYRAPYLFVNEVNKGIHIYDNSNPAAPQNISFISIPGNADIAVKGDILYADSYIDLLSFDISDPQNIVQTNRMLDVFPNRTYFNGWSADPALGVVADWIESDTTITTNCSTSWNGWNGGVFFTSDIASTESSGSSNNTTPTGPGLAGSTAKFAVVDNYLYCLSEGTMDLFDLTTPAYPQSAGEVNMGWNIETIFPYDHYLFIGSTSGVQIFDNTNPSAPSFLSTFSHYTSCDPVVVQGNYAYSTLRSGTFCDGYTNQLDIIDISTITQPELVKTYPMTNPYGLGIDGDYLFICDGSSGVKMYNASDVDNIELLKTVQVPQPMDVITAGGLLIITAADGIYEYGYIGGNLISYGHIPAQGI